MHKPIYRIIVPARMGSSSYGKNLKSVGGKPLIHWCLRALRTFDHVWLDTDSQFLERQLVGYYPQFEGIEVRKHSGRIFDLMPLHCEQLSDRDIIVLVQPTNPFVRPQDISRLIECLQDDHTWNSAQTICQLANNDHPVSLRKRSYTDDRVQWTHEQREKHKEIASQDRAPYYRFGNVVACRASKATEDLFAYPSKGFIIPRRYCFDCDEPEDFWIADKLMKGMKND